MNKRLGGRRWDKRLSPEKISLVINKLEGSFPGGDRFHYGRR